MNSPSNPSQNLINHLFIGELPAQEIAPAQQLLSEEPNLKTWSSHLSSLQRNHQIIGAWLINSNDPSEEVFTSHPPLVALLGFQGLSSLHQRGELDIVFIMTHPLHRQQKFASSLLRWAFEHWKSQFQKIWLEVSENNLGAITLYDRLGFKKAGLRLAYYADSSNALVLYKELE